MALGSAATREAICAFLVSGPASESAIAAAISLESLHPEILHTILRGMRLAGILAREELHWRLTAQVVVRPASTPTVAVVRSVEIAPRPYRCSRCKQEKHGDEFSRAQRYGGRSSYCRQCMREYHRERALMRQRASERNEKFCPKCGDFKPLVEFGPRASSRDGKQGYCRPCNANQRAIICAPPRHP